MALGNSSVCEDRHNRSRNGKRSKKSKKSTKPKPSKTRDKGKQLKDPKLASSAGPSRSLAPQGNVSNAGGPSQVIVLDDSVDIDFAGEEIVVDSDPEPILIDSIEPAARAVPPETRLVVAEGLTVILSRSPSPQLEGFTVAVLEPGARSPRLSPVRYQTFSPDPSEALSLIQQQLVSSPSSQESSPQRDLQPAQQVVLSSPERPAPIYYTPPSHSIELEVTERLSHLRSDRIRPGSARYYRESAYIQYLVALELQLPHPPGTKYLAGGDFTRFRRLGIAVASEFADSPNELATEVWSPHLAAEGPIHPSVVVLASQYIQHPSCPIGLLDPAEGFKKQQPAPQPAQVEPRGSKQKVRFQTPPVPTGVPSRRRSQKQPDVFQHWEPQQDQAETAAPVQQQTDIQEEQTPELPSPQPDQVHEQPCQQPLQDQPQPEAEQPHQVEQQPSPQPIEPQEQSPLDLSVADQEPPSEEDQDQRESSPQPASVQDQPSQSPAQAQPPATLARPSNEQGPSEYPGPAYGKKWGPLFPFAGPLPPYPFPQIPVKPGPPCEDPERERSPVLSPVQFYAEPRPRPTPARPPLIPQIPPEQQQSSSQTRRRQSGKSALPNQAVSKLPVPPAKARQPRPPAQILELPPLPPFYPPAEKQTPSSQGESAQEKPVQQQPARQKTPPPPPFQQLPVWRIPVQSNGNRPPRAPARTQRAAPAPQVPASPSVVQPFCPDLPTPARRVRAQTSVELQSPPSGAPPHSQQVDPGPVLSCSGPQPLLPQGSHGFHADPQRKESTSVDESPLADDQLLSHEPSSVFLAQDDLAPFDDSPIPMEDQIEQNASSQDKENSEPEAPLQVQAHLDQDQVMTTVQQTHPSESRLQDFAPVGYLQSDSFSQTSGFPVSQERNSAMQHENQSHVMISRNGPVMIVRHPEQGPSRSHYEEELIRRELEQRLQRRWSKQTVGRPYPQEESDRHRLEEELHRQRLEEELHRQRLEEDLHRRRLEEESNRQRHEEEMNLQRQQEELNRQRREEELNRQRHDEELNHQRREEELNRQRREEELNRQRHEEDLNRQRREEELNRQRLEEESNRRRLEEDLHRQRLEESNRQRLEQELNRQRLEQELSRREFEQDLHRRRLEQQSGIHHPDQGAGYRHHEQEMGRHQLEYELNRRHLEQGPSLHHANAVPVTHQPEQGPDRRHLEMAHPPQRPEQQLIQRHVEPVPVFHHHLAPAHHLAGQGPARQQSDLTIHRYRPDQGPVLQHPNPAIIRHHAAQDVVRHHPDLGPIHHRPDQGSGFHNFDQGSVRPYLDQVPVRHQVDQAPVPHHVGQGPVHQHPGQFQIQHHREPIPAQRPDPANRHNFTEPPVLHNLVQGPVLQHHELAQGIGQPNSTGVHLQHQQDGHMIEDNLMHEEALRPVFVSRFMGNDREDGLRVYGNLSRPFLEAVRTTVQEDWRIYEIINGRSPDGKVFVMQETDGGRIWPIVKVRGGVSEVPFQQLPEHSQSILLNTEGLSYNELIHNAGFHRVVVCPRETLILVHYFPGFVSLPWSFRPIPGGQFHRLLSLSSELADGNRTTNMPERQLTRMNFAGSSHPPRNPASYLVEVVDFGQVGHMGYINTLHPQVRASILAKLEAAFNNLTQEDPAVLLRRRLRPFSAGIRWTGGSPMSPPPMPRPSNSAESTSMSQGMESQEIVPHQVNPSSQAGPSTQSNMRPQVNTLQHPAFSSHPGGLPRMNAHPPAGVLPSGSGLSQNNTLTQRSGPPQSSMPGQEGGPSQNGMQAQRAGPPHPNMQQGFALAPEGGIPSQMSVQGRFGTGPSSETAQSSHSVGNSGSVQSSEVPRSSQSASSSLPVRSSGQTMRSRPVGQPRGSTFSQQPGLPRATHRAVPFGRHRPLNNRRPFMPFHPFRFERRGSDPEWPGGSQPSGQVGVLTRLRPDFPTRVTKRSKKGIKDENSDPLESLVSSSTLADLFSWARAVFTGEIGDDDSFMPNVIPDVNVVDATPADYETIIRAKVTTLIAADIQAQARTRLRVNAEVKRLTPVGLEPSEDAQVAVRTQAQARGKARAVIELASNFSPSAEVEAQARAQAEVKFRAHAAVNVRAGSESEAEARARAEAEARAREAEEAEASEEAESRAEAEAEARARAEASARPETETTVTTETETEPRTETEAEVSAGPEPEADVTAESEVHSMTEEEARAAAEAEERARAETEARERAEAEARERAEAEARDRAERHFRARARAMAAARARATEIRVEAEARARAEADTYLRDRHEVDMQARIYAHAITIAEAEADDRARAEAEIRAQEQEVRETRARVRIHLRSLARAQEQSQRQGRLRFEAARSYSTRSNSRFIEAVRAHAHTRARIEHISRALASNQNHYRLQSEILQHMRAAFNAEDEPL